VQAFAQPQPRCSTCALPVPDGVTQCGACLRTPPPWERCLAALPYAFPWAQLIGDLKFHDQWGLAATFATLLRSTPWVEPALEQCDVLVPIPLGPQRLRQRGYNQALVLARALERAGRPTGCCAATPGHQLPRQERLHALAALRLDPLLAPRLQGQRVVLLDDVMTTGATLWEAARVLRQHGVAHIPALALARADTED
jgi:ComF family protein